MAVTMKQLVAKVEEAIFDKVNEMEDLLFVDKQLYADPQVTSADPYERVIARRLRIKQKIAASRKKKEREEKILSGEIKEDEIEEESEEEDESENVVESQLENSTVKLLELIEDGNELVTNVKVAAVSYEVKRRDQHRKERAKRRSELEEAAKAANQKFMEIANMWAAIKKEGDPLDIHNATEDQRARCAEVISMKDKIIEHLKLELEEADMDFIKDLEKQEEEINILVERVNHQINTMRSAVRTELDLLEAAIGVEREEMMKSHEVEWDEMIKKKEEMEAETNAKRNDMFENHERAIDSMEVEQREQLKVKRSEQTKIIHDMQLQLQQMEALCLFSSEKLNHNFRVLKKRADENQIIKSQQKRTITKLQDIVSNLRKKIEKKEINLQAEMKRLQHEMTYLNQSVKDMEARASLFATQSNEKYLKLWWFNRNHAVELIKNIACAEKVMYEQFLDIPAPNLEVPNIAIEDLPSYKEGLKSSKELVKKRKGAPIDIFDDLNSSYEKKKVLQTILKSVAKYATFLIEDHVKDFTANFAPSEQVIIRLDNMLSTLGVRREDEILMVMKHFLPLLFCETCKEVKPYIVDEEELPESIVSEKSCDELMMQEITDHIRDLQGRDPYEEKPADVMEKISTSLTERLNIIDEVVKKEMYPVSEKHMFDASEESDKPVQTVAIPSIIECEKDEPVIQTIEEVLSLQKSDEICDIGNCVKHGHKISIDRLNLLKALCSFTNDLSANKEKPESKSLQAILSQRWVTVSRSLTESDVETFWNSFDVISKEREQLWDTFIEGLKEYHKGLTERARLNEEIKKVKAGNEELLRLLHHYLLSTSEEGISYNDLPDLKPFIPELDRAGE